MIFRIVYKSGSIVLSQSTRVTDGQMDRILIARPRLHSMQRGDNPAHVQHLFQSVLEHTDKHTVAR